MTEKTEKQALLSNKIVCLDLEKALDFVRRLELISKTKTGILK